MKLQEIKDYYMFNHNVEKIYFFSDKKKFHFFLDCFLDNIYLDLKFEKRLSVTNKYVPLEVSVKYLCDELKRIEKIWHVLKEMIEEQENKGGK